MIAGTAWPIALLTLVLSQPAGEDASASVDSDAQLMGALRQYYLQEASAYDFFLDAEHQKPLTLQTKPLMHWGMLDGWSGAIYVWTCDGRPQLIGCIGSGLESNHRRSVFHEFHSLSEQPLAPIKINGARQWQWSPEGAGAKLREFPDAPAPRSSPILRRSQMRSLAQQFSAEIGNEPLRLMPRPLYQFGSEEGSQCEGAIFAFALAEGTDPELLVLLERRKVESEQHWFYAPARFSNREMRLKLQGQEVWQVERYGEQWQTNRPKQSYLTVWIKWVTMDEIKSAGE